MYMIYMDVVLSLLDESVRFFFLTRLGKCIALSMIFIERLLEAPVPDYYLTSD